MCMETNDPPRPAFKVVYFNSIAMLVMVLIITIEITRPLSGEGLFSLLKQRWFYGPFGGTFAAIAYLFMIIESITSKLDQHCRWERQYMKRIFLQATLAWISPSVIIALMSWLYFDTLDTKVMLAMYNWSMFLVLLAIALFINVSYILYYFYRFVNHLAAIEQESEKDKQKVGRNAFFLVPDGKGQTKLSMSEIAYIFYEQGNVILRTVSGINYPLDQSLESVEKILEVNNFQRVNRNYIISYVSYVSWKRSPGKGMSLTLKPPANDEVIVSRMRVKGTKQWIGEDPSLL